MVRPIEPNIGKRKAGATKTSKKRLQPARGARSRRQYVLQTETIEQNKFFVIEKLLDKRYNENGYDEYLVRWQSYSSDWDSWEPEYEIERNSWHMISEYNRNLHQSSEDNRLYCICQRPYRFENGGMIQCINCFNWFHFECIQMSLELANSLSRYDCEECKKQTDPTLID